MLLQFERKILCNQSAHQKNYTSAWYKNIFYCDLVEILKEEISWHCPLVSMTRFMAFFSLTMVLISTCTFVISTIDELQENEKVTS